MQIYRTENIDLEELSSEKFCLDESIKRAKEILTRLKEDDEIFDEDFEDDKWMFEQHLSKGIKIVFDFSELENLCRFHEDWDASMVLMVKCWVCELLREFYPESVRQKYNYLVKVLEQTNFFSSDKMNDFIEYLRNYTPTVKRCLDEKENMDFNIIEYELNKDRSGIASVYQIINTSLNFLTFCEINSFHGYYGPLLDIKKGLPTEKFSRQLPKGKDVLILDYSINQYFESGFSTPSCLFFAPILLWWRITNIIPMRISEFCHIKRDCISQSNGKYYITLPRIKKPATKRRIQVVDKLEITKDIFDMIMDYTNLTNPYGFSKTLISYRTILRLEVKNTSRLKKRELDYFDSGNFSMLLKRYYKEVVYEEHNKEIEREVRPNDTRHFAFCSLLMQGISPIEIARLGGHSSIEAQYHYSNHTEYFIDIEVKKLIDGFQRKDGKLSGTTFSGQEITFKDIEDRSLQFPSQNNKTRLPMEIGFCTDEYQRCESEECMLCEHWWIHPENLVEAKPLIDIKIRDRKQKISEMGSFLKNINESFSTEMLKQNELHPYMFTKINTEAVAIQDHLEEIARLEILKGDKENE